MAVLFICFITAGEVMEKKRQKPVCILLNESKHKLCLSQGGEEKKYLVPLVYSSSGADSFADVEVVNLFDDDYEGSYVAAYDENHPTNLVYFCYVGVHGTLGSEPVGTIFGYDRYMYGSDNIVKMVQCGNTNHSIFRTIDNNEIDNMNKESSLFMNNTKIIHPNVEQQTILVDYFNGDINLNEFVLSYTRAGGNPIQDYNFKTYTAESYHDISYIYDDNTHLDIDKFEKFSREQMGIWFYDDNNDKRVEDKEKRIIHNSHIRYSFLKLLIQLSEPTKMIRGMRMYCFNLYVPYYNDTFRCIVSQDQRVRLFKYSIHEGKKSIDSFFFSTDRPKHYLDDDDCIDESAHLYKRDELFAYIDEGFICNYDSNYSEDTQLIDSSSLIDDKKKELLGFLLSACLIKEREVGYLDNYNAYIDRIRELCWGYDISFEEKTYRFWGTICEYDYEIRITDILERDFDKKRVAARIKELEKLKVLIVRRQDVFEW